MWRTHAGGLPSCPLNSICWQKGNWRQQTGADFAKLGFFITISFLIWKMGWSFLWGVTDLGQSQNSGQPQCWAPACKQLLICSQLCFFSPLYCLFWWQHCKHLKGILFPVYSVQQYPSSYCFQTASQMLKATLKFLAPLCLFDISHHIIEHATDFIRIRFQDFLSEMFQLLILRHMFTNIFS